MRGLVIGMLLLGLAGCATTGRQELEARLAGLVGASEAELVRRVGVPARVHEAEGRRFLAYVERWPDVAYAPWAGFGGGYWGRGGGFGMGYGFAAPQLIERYCEATFEVSGGRVAGFSLRGSSCGWSGFPVVQP